MKLWRLFLFAFVLLGCGCTRPPLQKAVPLAPTLPSATALLQALADQGEAFSSLRGEAAVRAKLSGQKLTVTQVVFAQRPDRFRTETLSPFGTPLLLLAAAAPDLAVYLPTQGTFYQGEASVANLSRFTRMPLRLEDLVGLLLHSVPRFPYQQAATRLENEQAVLELTGGERVVQRFGFDGANRLVQAVYQVGERVELQIDYQDFALCQGGFPRQIVVAMPERQLELALQFTDELVCNAPLGEDRFRLLPPVGVEPQPFP